MTTPDFTAPVKISDLYELALNRRLTAIRQTLSQLDTERLRKFAQTLSHEMKRLDDHHRFAFRLIADEVCQILEARQSDDAFARLLGGVA
jgi:hypothetical protein